MVKATRQLAVSPESRPEPRTAARAYDPLMADHIGFDAWLLPPLEADRTEKIVQLVSRVAGPIALALSSIVLAHFALA